VRWSQFSRTRAIRQSAAFACRSPQRLSRGRWLSPLLACLRLTPQSEANERALTSRWGLSPAARSNVEATSEPKPLRAVKAGATCSVMRNGRGQW